MRNVIERLIKELTPYNIVNKIKEILTLLNMNSGGLNPDEETLSVNEQGLIALGVVKTPMEVEIGGERIKSKVLIYKTKGITIQDDISYQGERIRNTITITPEEIIGSYLESEEENFFSLSGKGVRIEGVEGVITVDPRGVGIRGNKGYLNLNLEGIQTIAGELKYPEITEKSFIPVTINGNKANEKGEVVISNLGRDYDFEKFLRYSNGDLTNSVYKYERSMGETFQEIFSEYSSTLLNLTDEDEVDVIDIFTKELIMNATVSELLSDKIPSQLEGRSFAINQLAS